MTPSPSPSRPFAAAIAALLAISAVAVAGCTPEAERETKKNTAAAERSIDRALDRVEESLDEAGSRLESQMTEIGEEMEPRVEDAALTARIKARLTAHPDVNPLDVDVDVVAGRVTLSGVVESDVDRRAAEEIARNTRGVVAVDNRITVGPRG